MVIKIIQNTVNYCIIFLQIILGIAIGLSVLEGFFVAASLSAFLQSPYIMMENPETSAVQILFQLTRKEAGKLYYSWLILF